METYLLILLTSYIVSLILTPVVRDIAIRINAVDKPSKRKIHASETPLLGGLAVYISFMVAISLGFLINPRFKNLVLPHTYGFLFGGAIIVAVGIYDDLFELKPLKKFLWQLCVASIFVLSFNGVIEMTTLPFIHKVVKFNYYFSVFCSILWIVGITNAMNFVDGLDGLCSGMSFIASVTLTIVCISHAEFLIAAFYIGIAGSVMGFGKYNSYPAKIFLGDTGSMFLGYSLGCFAIMSSTKSTTFASLLIPLVALGIPVFDMLWVVVRRKTLGISVFEADKRHFHHKLLEKGYTSKQVVRILYLVSIVFSAITFLFIRIKDEAALLIVVVIGLLVLTFGRNLSLWEKKKIELLEKRKSESDQDS